VTSTEVAAVLIVLSAFLVQLALAGVRCGGRLHAVVSIYRELEGPKAELVMQHNII
jgi:hypothetical protein